MVLHMLVHGVWFDVLWHLHFSVGFLIHSLYMLTWNEKLFLCSLDLVACMIIALSCILLLMRLDLFTACGVHRSYYSCFLCGLICSPLCITMLWLWPMWFRHGVHLQYRCDFQLVGRYPCFEMTCPCDPYFSCYGWRVGFACDHWWFFLLLWLLCLSHMHFDLLYCLSALCLSWGLSKLIWWNIMFSTSGGVDVFCWVWRLIWLAWFEGELVIHLGFRKSIVFCHWETLSFGCCPLELENLCLPSIWLDLRGSWCFCLVYYISCFSLIFSSYSPKSLCFTCYTGLYLLNYAYHCAGWVVMRCEPFC
jgi:hypothetical protein